MPEIRLTGVDGTQIGIVRTSEALAMAEEAGVDLVEVAAKANPPVCRLMDYGKFRYQEQKRQQEIKAKQKVIQVKEVKFRPATDENDYQTKLRALTRFLNDGNKAKVTLRYRGREMAHQDIGQDVLARIRDDCPSGILPEIGRSPNDYGTCAETQKVIKFTVSYPIDSEGLKLTRRTYLCGRAFKAVGNNNK